MSAHKRPTGATPKKRGRAILGSWIPSANAAEADFPLGNLPYGCFDANGGRPHLGVAIGDRILDLHALASLPLVAALAPELRAALQAPVLNPLLALGAAAAAQLRRRLTELLAANAHPSERAATAPCLREFAGANLRLPFAVGEFSDFYASVDHAQRVGALLRPERPLQPNYRHLPVGYQGRGSTVVVSGAPVRRPQGQWLPAGAQQPVFAPTRQLDFELELGFVIATGNPDGNPIPLSEARQHIFGVCLLNDWSARDVQRWEGQPLGPFLGKSFATSISPWIVPLEALAPYTVPPRARAAEDPPLLPYLNDPDDRGDGALDIILEVELSTAAMRQSGAAPQRICLSHARDLFWTPGQLIAHHTSNGCRLRPGDLLASGSVSGPQDSSRGCLLELTAGPAGIGTRPLRLPSGETRSFLQDGDEVRLRGWAGGARRQRLGLSECRTLILPAQQM